MGEIQEVLLDTCVLLSKKFGELSNKKLAINELVILEYFQVLKRKINDSISMKKNADVEGRKMQLRIFGKMLRENKIRIIGNISYDDVEQAASLIIDQQVDAGDALLAVFAKKHGMSIFSTNGDFDRLKNVCKLIKL